MDQGTRPNPILLLDLCWVSDGPAVLKNQETSQLFSRQRPNVLHNFVYRPHHVVYHSSISQ